MPAVPDSRPLAAGGRVFLVRGLSAPGFGYDRDDLPRHTHASDRLVRGFVERHFREERRLGQDPSKASRLRFLSDGMDHAPPLPDGHGETWPGAAERQG